MSPPLMLLSARFGYYMKLIRKLHLYLGCLFAPLIIFFSITGAWQTFNFHESSKDKTYTPLAWVSTLSEVHKNQRTELYAGCAPFSAFALVHRADVNRPCGDDDSRPLHGFQDDAQPACVRHTVRCRHRRARSFALPVAQFDFLRGV